MSKVFLLCAAVPPSSVSFSAGKIARAFKKNIYNGFINNRRWPASLAQLRCRFVSRSPACLLLFLSGLRSVIAADRDFDIREYSGVITVLILHREKEKKREKECSSSPVALFPFLVRASDISSIWCLCHSRAPRFIDHCLCVAPHNTQTDVHTQLMD